MPPSHNTVRILICDPIGLRLAPDGKPDISAVRHHIEALGGVFNVGQAEINQDGKIHFHYLPHLSIESEILALTGHGQFDAVIAAATLIPRGSIFDLGGVRIGAGTGNMASASWGGGNGHGGVAPLMNTPSFNSRATAQMAMKALLHFLPDLPFAELHQRSSAGNFDTGKDLVNFPTEKLEGKTIAILGYGNIGREMAVLARAFHMKVKIYARENHRTWIESEGFSFATTPGLAAEGADILSVHTGLGPKDPATGKFANEAIVNSEILSHLNFGATLINFDRGECVDATALDEAMLTGQIRFAAIDADIFKNPDGSVTGPLTRYLPLAGKFGSRILLLPHAAADTCHTSRVEGAKQAVTQILEAIRTKRVTNLKGDLPEGYADAGLKTVLGVGKVLSEAIAAALKEKDFAPDIKAHLNTMAHAWENISNSGEIDPSSATTLLKAINTHATMLRKYGLEGPV